MKIAIFQSKKNALALKLAANIKVLTKEDLSLMTSEDRKKPYDCQSKTDFNLSMKLFILLYF